MHLLYMQRIGSIDYRVINTGPNLTIYRGEERTTHNFDSLAKAVSFIGDKRKEMEADDRLLKNTCIILILIGIALRMKGLL